MVGAVVESPSVTFYFAFLLPSVVVATLRVDNRESSVIFREDPLRSHNREIKYFLVSRTYPVRKNPQQVLVFRTFDGFGGGPDPALRVPRLRHCSHLCCTSHVNLLQGCTIPGRQVAWVTKFCTVASSVWNILRITLLVPRLLRWLLDFCTNLFTPDLLFLWHL